MATVSEPIADTQSAPHAGGEAPLDLYENIPDELKLLRQWVGLKLVPHPKGKKPKKVPINPATGRTAAVDEPKSWGTFDEAVTAVTRYTLAGIGFVFTKEDPYAGIDLDECRDPTTGALQPWALDVVQRVDSYTEASVSGTGVHIIPKGTLPGGGGQHGGVEMYDRSRYFVMTGEHIGGTPPAIEAQQDAIDALYAEHFPHKLNGKATATTSTATTSTAQHNALWRELDEALPFIPAVAYEDWLHVGMGIHAVDSSETGLALWVEWSQTCPEKFDLAACLKRWQSFSPDGGITEKTLFALAIDHGWRSAAGKARAEMDEPAPEWSEEEENAYYTAQERPVEADAPESEWSDLQANEDATQRPAPDATRAHIRITVNMTRVVNEAEHAVLALPMGPPLFQRLNQLCFVTHSAAAPKWLKRPLGAPSIASCSTGQLRERMSVAAEWLKWTARTKEWTPALPPAWAVETLHGRQEWNFPVLADVISAPTLREDGEIIHAPGYDRDTGLFLDTQDVTFPPIPTQPTLDDAVRAVAALKEPLVDFPFAAEHGRSALLSSILSQVVRPAINGCVPLFAVDSTTRGTGKGLLIDCSTVIATGRPAPRWAQARDEEEDRKALLTIGMEGDPCVHIDNVTHALGSGALDSALTARTIKGRLLGQNKTVEAPMTCVFFASGNNLSYVGDTARRVVPIRLESLLEKPENRDDFQQPRLLDWVRQERPRLVVEALTILKAYFVADCPKQGIPAYGSFEAWSDLVRSALVWAGCADPCEGRTTIEAESDPGYENLARLLHCWAACYESKAVTLNSVIQDISRRAVDTSQVINTANEWNELSEAVAAFDSRYDGKRLDVNRIGNALRPVKGRVIGGQRLIHAGKSHQANLWAIQKV